MHVTHLRLENWRNFTRVDAPLERRMFIVGPNASGKSNLLDAFRFLHDIVTVGGGFQEAVERRGGVSRIRSLAARKFPHVVVSATMGNGNGAPLWEYTIRFSAERGKAVLREESVTRNGGRLLVRPDEDDKKDPERLRQTHLEQVIANRDFRVIADFFASIRYLHLVPQLVREPDRSTGRKRDPYGGDFLQQVASTPKNTQDARLRRLREALKVAVPQLAELELWKDEAGKPHLRGLYEHWRPNAGWQTEEQFSDGTLRLLGLLWSLMDGNGPLLLEEPELSLHPEVVSYIPQMMAYMQRQAGRQVLVSTHSVDLLRDPGIGSDEVLLLVPGQEGTTVDVAATDDQIRALLDGGLSMGEAVLPRSRPLNAAQLSMFGQ